MPKSKKNRRQSDDSVDSSSDDSASSSDESVEQKKRHRKKSKKIKKSKSKRKDITSESESDSSSDSSSSTSNEDVKKRKKQKKQKKHKSKNRQDASSSKGAAIDSRKDPSKVMYISSEEGTDRDTNNKLKRIDELKKLRGAHGSDDRDYKSKWDSPSEDHDRKRLKSHPERDREDSLERSKERKRHDSGRKPHSPARTSSHRKDDGKNGGEKDERRHQYHERKQTLSVSPAESPQRRRERNQNLEREFRDSERDGNKRGRYNDNSRDNRNFNRRSPSPQQRNEFNRNRQPYPDRRPDRRPDNNRRPPNFNDRGGYDNRRGRNNGRPPFERRFSDERRPDRQHHDPGEREQRSGGGNGGGADRRDRSPIRQQHNPFRRGDAGSRRFNAGRHDDRREEKRDGRPEHRPEPRHHEQRPNRSGSRSFSPPPTHRNKNRSRSANRSQSRSPKRSRKFPVKESSDNESYEWGKKSQQGRNGDQQPEVEKEKPNFGLSGKLTEDTNTVNGIVVKYAEPPEARKPKRRWRLYPFKGDQVLPTLYIHRQSCYLIGRDRKICDLAVDHPSCSKQHAVLQYRLVPYVKEDGTKSKRVRPYVLDLDSANGTFVNNNQIETKKYVELLEKDVIKFGFSSREYVILHEHSKDDDTEDEMIQDDISVKSESRD